MAEINLTDSKGRDAVVSAESVASPLEMRWVDEEGAQVLTKKILRCTAAQDMDALLGEFGGLEETAAALLNGDPELDIETFGLFLRDTSRVYVNPDKEVVHKITQWEIVHHPDGSERERRPKKLGEPNVNAETPIKWTGKLMKKAEACRRFVFSGQMQIAHVNGLTYDFLYSMAKELAEKDSLMLVAAGTKGTEPLVFRRAGLPYRGFLEGRIDGDKYALILHLTNLELKTPPPVEDSRE